MTPTDDAVTKVVTGRIRSIFVYEISEHELSQFEQGSAATLELNFGVALVSLAIAGIFTLCTATSYKPASMEFILWAFATLGFVVGIFLIGKWAVTTPSISRLATTVRNRATTAEQGRSNAVFEASPVIAKLADDPVQDAPN